jgi:xylulokinase
VILAVDCGLSAVKLTLATREGAVVQVEREPYPTSFARDRAEQQPGDWWRALQVACRRIEKRGRVELIVPTGHMHGLVLLDRAGDPVLPCLTLHDRRGEELLRAFDPLAFQVATGQFLDASLPLAKLLWLADAHAELLARATVLLAPKDYLGMRLTGAIATDPIDAAGTGLYELGRGRWSAEIAELARVPESLLPPIEACDASRGRLLAGAAEDLGLPSSAVVAVGAGDDIELLGATGYRVTDAVEHVGTSGAILRAVVDPGATPELEIMPTAEARMRAAGAAISNCGAVTSWIETVLDVPLEAALDTAPSVDDPIALPRLLPERHPNPPEAGGASITGLRMRHDRRDIARALLTGVAGKLRDLLERVERASGDVDTLVVSGGSPCPAWIAFRAAAYARPILVLDVDPTARGCIALGMVASGSAASIQEAARSAPMSAREVTPDPGLVPTLRELFERADAHLVSYPEVTT